MATTSKKTITSKKVIKPKTEAVKKTLDSTNKKATTQKVIIHRDLKYIYPKGCKDTVARKAFRQKVRNRLNKFTIDMDKLKGADLKNMKANLTAYKTEFLVQ